jgi:hypothetical protein
MYVINIIAIIGIFILSIATILILYNYFKENHFFMSRPRRRNRISPEMFHVLARIIQERNNEEESKKEIELTPIKQNKFVIIVNPDNKISLGSENIK